MSDTSPTPRRGLTRMVPQDRGSRRLLMFAGVSIVGALILALYFGSTAPKVEVSQTRGAPGQVGNPNSNVPPPPSMVNSLQQRDHQIAEQAFHSDPATGVSATPTPIIQSQGNRLPTSLVDGGNEQAPERPIPRALPVPVPVAVPAPQQPSPLRPNSVYGAPQPVPVTPPVDNDLMQAMLKQMAQLEPRAPNGVQTTWFYNNGAAGAASAAGRNGAAAGSTTQVASNSSAPAAPLPSTSGRQGRFIVPAPGTILYSRLVGRVNSDTPGPVIGEILQGPFSGARLLGTFEFSEQGVVINFSSMTVPYKDDDGADQSELVPIHAVAVDASHLGTAMATDIDRHLLERIGVAFGTAFLQGIGQAVAESGATATYGVGGTTIANSALNTREQLLIGAGSAAGAAGQVFNQIYGNRRTTITVEADTPFGLLFLNNN